MRPTTVEYIHDDSSGDDLRYIRYVIYLDVDDATRQWRITGADLAAINGRGFLTHEAMECASLWGMHLYDEPAVMREIAASIIWNKTQGELLCGTE